MNRLHVQNVNYLTLWQHCIESLKIAKDLLSQVLKVRKNDV